MGLERRAFRISKETWKEIGSPYEYTVEKYAGRKTVDVAIGTEQQPGGEVYVTEPFFVDILPLVFSKDVIVHLDMYSDPPVVLEKDGRLILHNADIDVAKEMLSDALKDTYVSNQIRAITEIRMNQYNASRLGSTTKVLRDSVSYEFDRKINYDFLRLFLREKYQLCDVISQTPIALDISLLNKTELLSLYGGILEYQNTNSCKFEPLKGLLQKGYGIAEIEKHLKDEIAKRFFSGEIH